MPLEQDLDINEWISSKLKLLPNFRSMALELIQNADDESSNSISFNFKKTGLEVRNNSTFTSCKYVGIEKRSGCENFGKQLKRRYCDWHGISTFNSGNKKMDSNSTGRFGVGFVSVYRFCDKPQITSGSYSAVWDFTKIKSFDPQMLEQKEYGTTIWLPWAKPKSALRNIFEVPAPTLDEIEKFPQELMDVAPNIMLFLRNISSISIYEDDKLLANFLKEGVEAIQISRYDDTGDSEIIGDWLVYSAELVELERFYDNPQFRNQSNAEQTRSTQVSVAVPVKPTFGEASNYLHAFLPTLENSNCGFAIQADFALDPSRERLLRDSSGQSWNDALIEAAILGLVENLPELVHENSQKSFWHLISSFLDEYERSPNGIVSRYWPYVRDALKNIACVSNYEGQMRMPNQIFINPVSRTGETRFALERTLKVLGIDYPNLELYPFQKALGAAGVRDLDTKVFVPVLVTFVNSGKLEKKSKLYGDRTFLDSWKDIWTTLEFLMSKSAAKNEQLEIAHLLKTIPIFPSYVSSVELEMKLAKELVNFGEVYKVHGRKQFLEVFLRTFNEILVPDESLLSEKSHPQLLSLVPKFNFLEVLRKNENQQSVLELALQCHRESLVDEFDSVYEVYSLWASREDSDRSSAERELKIQKIWPVRSGQFKTSHEILIPDDFEDPLGQSEILMESMVGNKGVQWASRIGAQRQSFEHFCFNVLPEAIGEFDDDDLEVRLRILRVLKMHLSVIEQNSKLREFLSDLPFFPALDSSWKPAKLVHRMDSELRKILGDSQISWLDTAKIDEKGEHFSVLWKLGYNPEVNDKLIFEIWTMMAQNSHKKEPRLQMKALLEYFADRFRNADDMQRRALSTQLREVSSYPIVFNGRGEWLMPVKFFSPIYLGKLFDLDSLPLGGHVIEFQNRKIDKEDSAFLDVIGVNKMPTLSMSVSFLIKRARQGNDHSKPLLEFILRDSENLTSIQKDELRETRFIKVEDTHYCAADLYLDTAGRSLGAHFTPELPDDLKRFKKLLLMLGLQLRPELSDFVSGLEKIVSKELDLDLPIEHYRRAWQLIKRRVEEADNPEDFETLVTEAKACGLIKKLIIHNFDSGGESKTLSETVLNDSPGLASDLIGHFADAFSFLLTDIPVDISPSLRNFFEMCGVNFLSSAYQASIVSVSDSEIKTEIMKELERRSDRLAYAARLLDGPHSFRADPVLSKYFSELKICVSSEFTTLCRLVTTDGREIFRGKTAKADFGLEVSEEGLPAAILYKPNIVLGSELFFRGFLRSLYPNAGDSQIDAASANLTLRFSEPDDSSSEVKSRHHSLSESGPEEEFWDESAKLSISHDQQDATEDYDFIVPPDEDEISGNLEPKDSSAYLELESANLNMPRNVLRTSPPVHMDSGEDSSVVVGENLDSQLRDPESSRTWEVEIENYSDTDVLQRFQQSKPSASSDQSSNSRGWVPPNGVYVQGTVGVSSLTSKKTQEIGRAAEAAVKEAEEAEGRTVFVRKRGNGPGYDLKSVGPSGDVRYIEIKGTEKDWANNKAVYISSRQFMEAQARQSDFWLYVVEWALDDRRRNIEKIQNPSLYIDRFYFNSEWKQVAKGQDRKRKNQSGL